MAENKKDTKKSHQSRIRAANQKNTEIFQKNPNLVLQFQNQMKVAGPKLKQMYNKIKDSKTYNIIKDIKDPIDFAHEKVSKFIEGRNLIYQLTEFKELAKRYRNPEVEEKAGKVIKNLPTSRKRGMDHRIAEIEEIVKTGKPNLSKRFENVKKTYDEFGSRIINEVNKANKVKQISKLKTATKWLKGGEKIVKGVSVPFDIISLLEFVGKLRQKKAKTGDWVDAGISALSLTGTALGFAALTAAGASLAPAAAVIATVALTAGLAKLAYDKLLSDEALKAYPKKKQIKPVTINPFEMTKFFENDKSQYIPKQSIPRNARGTSYFPGGLSLVGEEGPELVNLPRGSQVFSNSRTRSLLNGMGSGNAGISVNYSPQITIQGNADAHVMKTASDNSYADFERKFNALMDRRRRLSFAGG